MNKKLKIFAVLAFLGLSFAGAVAQQGGGIQGGQGGGGGFPTTGTAFTVSWGSGGSQACGSTADQSWKYFLSGTAVSLVMQGELNCTGSSTSFISAPNAIPAAIRQNVSQPVFLGVIRTQDNGTDTAGCLYIETDFSMTVRKIVTSGVCTGAGTSTWTASGTRALMGTSNVGPNSFFYTTVRN